MYACIPAFLHVVGSPNPVCGVFTTMLMCMYVWMYEHHSDQTLLSIDLSFYEYVIGRCCMSNTHFCTSRTRRIFKLFFNHVSPILWPVTNVKLFWFLFNYSTIYFHCSRSSYVDKITRLKQWLRNEAQEVNLCVWNSKSLSYHSWKKILREYRI